MHINRWAVAFLAATAAATAAILRSATEDARRHASVIHHLTKMEDTMATNQDKINQLTSTVTKIYGEVTSSTANLRSEVERLKAQAAAGEQLDWSGLEQGLQQLDDVNADVVAPAAEAPAEPEATPPAEPEAAAEPAADSGTADAAADSGAQPGDSGQ